MTNLIYDPPVKRYFVNGKGKLREVDICIEAPPFSTSTTGTNYTTRSLASTKAEAVALKVARLQDERRLAQQAKEDAECKIDCISIMIDKVEALETGK